MFLGFFWKLEKLQGKELQITTVKQCTKQIANYKSACMCFLDYVLLLFVKINITYLDLESISVSCACINIIQTLIKENEEIRYKHILQSKTHRPLVEQLPA